MLAVDLAVQIVLRFMVHALAARLASSAIVLVGALIVIPTAPSILATIYTVGAISFTKLVVSGKA